MSQFAPGDCFDTQLFRSHGYEIRERLSARTTSHVFTARDVNSGRCVVLKCQPLSGNRNATVKALFAQARILKAVAHRHIVCCLLCSDEPIPFYVMPYADRGTVNDLLARRSVVDIAQGVTIVRSVLLALDHLHTHGVIHGDVKASNVLISASGSVLLADFGSAFSLREPVLTFGYRNRSGTPGVMSPELIKGFRETYCSEIYAAGVLLYQLLCGVMPFSGKSVWEIEKCTLESSVVLPSTRRPELGNAFDDVLMKALAKNPRARFRNASEFLSVLQHCSKDFQ